MIGGAGLNRYILPILSGLVLNWTDRRDAHPSLEPKGNDSRIVCREGDDKMYDDRPNQDDATRLTGRERLDHGVHPIGDVLAELLGQYRVRFPEINVAVVEEPSSAN